jgi:hypothetical protein
MHLSRGLFAYQIFVRAQALPTTNNLLHETILTSSELRESMAAPEPSIQEPIRGETELAWARFDPANTLPTRKV